MDGALKASAGWDLKELRTVKITSTVGGNGRRDDLSEIDASIPAQLDHRGITALGTPGALPLDQSDRAVPSYCVTAVDLVCDIY